MDVKTGNILSPELMGLLRKSNNGELPSQMREMVVPPTPQQLQQGRIGPYDPCPCGSGEKFKFCCFRSGDKNV